MTPSAISHYRGTIDEVAPMAQTLKTIYLKYAVGYRLSCFRRGPNEGVWCAIVAYAGAATYKKTQAFFLRPRIAAGFCRSREVRREDQP